MKRLAAWGYLWGGLLAATTLRAQTVPAVGSPPSYIKAVPQTERKPKPERVDELTLDQPHLTDEVSEKQERSARGPRSASGSHGVRGPHANRSLGSRGLGHGH